MEVWLGGGVGGGGEGEGWRCGWVEVVSVRGGGGECEGWRCGWAEVVFVRGGGVVGWRYGWRWCGWPCVRARVDGGLTWPASALSAA